MKRGDTLLEAGFNEEYMNNPIMLKAMLKTMGLQFRPDMCKAAEEFQQKWAFFLSELTALNIKVNDARNLKYACLSAYLLERI